KTKPGFWVGIDKKFLVREVSRQSEVGELDSNAVVYGLYRIQVPDINRLMPIKDGALNCHFDQAKRGHGLTETRQQKIDTWEKKMHIPGARVQDVAELEKILKQPIKLLDITHGTIFNSKKYRSGKYKEIEIVVHNVHVFPRNQHFPRDRIVEYYKNDTWEAINNALQGPQAIWLIGVGDENQTISQFVLEDGRTFRTWKKHTDIINACKELFEDMVDWQFWEGIISEEKKQESLESLKVVDLAEQVFGTNHAGSRLANEINKWYPTPISVHENIKQSCIEHGHGGRWNAPDYCVQDVVCIDMKSCYPAIAVNGELPENDITGFVQVRSFKFASNTHLAIPVWYGKHFACRSGEGCRKEKGWTGILESVTIGEAIISLTKQTKVWLPKNRNINEGELDFLIKDCTDAGTFAEREKSYAHINLLEMLQRFEPNEVQVEVKPDNAEYRISNFPNLCSYYPSCAMCTDPEEFFISKSKYAKWIKEFLKTKMPLVKNEYKRHKPYICRFCFGEWFYRLSDSYALLHQPKEQEIRKIQPGQWHDKGKKIYGPNEILHWELIKNITESTAPSIHNPITRSQVSYLNGGGGSGKTTHAIRIFKDINMVVFTHMNALAKNFQNDCKVKAQTWHSFFRWNGMGEWISEHMGKKKFPWVVIWDEGMRRKNNRMQSELFCGAIPVIEKWKYLEKEWSPSDRILSAHRLSRRLASQIYLKLHCTKYSEIPIPLIYRPKDGCKQNCLVPIPGSSEKKELVKNDIVHLPLNILPNKFLQGMLGKEKAIDWELGFAITIHTSQGMTLKAPQLVWVIDEHLAWDNLIYLAVGR
ncbi:22586_t:CDS:2, partial [Gigaspora margarita]